MACNTFAVHSFGESIWLERYLYPKIGLLKAIKKVGRKMYIHDLKHAWSAHSGYECELHYP